MDPLRLFNAWYNLVIKAFTEHTIATAVISIAAIGIFVVLQKEYRPFRLLTNAGFVLLGWVVAITGLPFAMAGAGKGWAALETAAPWASRIGAYLFGIYERHPILVLVIVGLGCTAYLLERSWPAPIAWGPVRAVFTLLGIVLLVHMSGPIADLVMGEPEKAPAPPKFSAPVVPAKDAAAAAIKAGDLRYLSVPRCIDEVSGYPASEAGKPDIAPPGKVGVKKLGPACDDTLGSEGIARVYATGEYATEYNRLMYEHNSKAAEAKPAESKPGESGSKPAQ
jgi:hypothetical protein